MITFIVEKDDVSKTIQFSTDGTLLDLKKEIIKMFDLKCKYIDVISTIERPIRALGMFNFDIGLQPRTLDNYPFNRYNLDGRTITLTYEINDEYLNNTILEQSITGGLKLSFPKSIDLIISTDIR